MTRICYITRNGGERSALLRRSWDGRGSWSDGGLAGAPSARRRRDVDAAGDRAALAALEAALADARAAADDRPPLVVLASCLGQLGVAPALRALVLGRASLRQARDDWLRRLETSQKSESALVAYRVAIDDLLDWSEANGAERARRGDDRRLPERLPAAGAAGAGDLLPPLPPPPPVPALGQPARRRARSVPRPRAASEAAAGARLADPRGVSRVCSTLPAVPSGTCPASPSATGSCCSRS